MTNTKELIGWNSAVKEAKSAFGVARNMPVSNRLIIEADDLIQQLQARCEELERELKEEQSAHQTTYSLMLSGEKRGVEKGREESQQKINQLAVHVERLREVWQSAGGCSSHSCTIRAPEGMGTNSGCRCYDNRNKMLRLTQLMGAAIQQAPEQSLSDKLQEVARKAFIEGADWQMNEQAYNEGVIAYAAEDLNQVAADIIRLAEAEGLGAHAQAIALRRKRNV